MTFTLIKAIRERLGVTQSELATGMGCTQSNVSFYEKGQTVPPAVATKLISFAKAKGLSITFDHVYGNGALPDRVKHEPESRAGA